MDTLASAIGTNVRLVTTLPLSENPPRVDAPDGDATEPSLSLQATAAKRSSDVHKRVSMVFGRHSIHRLVNTIVSWTDEQLR